MKGEWGKEDPPTQPLGLGRLFQFFVGKRERALTAERGAGRPGDHDRGEEQKGKIDLW